MAIYMTREEYKQKYGVTPVIPVSNLDITPAPRRMTRAEYNAEYGPKPQLDILGPAKEAVSGLAQTYTTFPSKIWQDIKEGSTDITTGAKNPSLGEGSAQMMKGMAKTGLRVAGDTASLIFAPIGAALQAIGFNKLTDWISKELVNTKAGNAITDIKAIQDFAIQHPNAEEDFNRALMLGMSALETGKIEPQTVIPRTIEQVKTTPSQISGVVNKGVDTFLNNIEKTKTTPSPSDIEKSSAKLEQEIYNIQNNYSKLRRANEYSSDEGVASRKRIAQTDVLANSVDVDGTIRTKQPGGAIDQYKAKTIDGVEGIVRDNLIRENGKTNLSEVQRKLTLEINRSGLEGADLITALNGVRKEIAGLRLKADEFGDVPNVLLHDAKINTTKNINYQTPPETATYRKAVARGYKKLVEEKSNFNVEEVNAELAKYYTDIKTLEGLDGRKVKGGRLGKYSAQIAGNIAGGIAGSAIGGFTGGAIGTIVGGEVGSLIKGKTMAGTFGSERGMEIPRNPILEQARIDAKLPPVTDLKLPDPIVGSPKGIPKTKEVLGLEGEIKKNVEAQKKAITKGDFTLVAKLKEIYAYLVAELKAVIKRIKETPNKKGGFVKNPFSREPKSGNLPEKGIIEPQQSSTNPTTQSNLLQETQKYSSAEEFVKGQGFTFELETAGGEKRIIPDLWASDAVKGKGIAREETLLAFKNAFQKGHKIIEPSNGMWTTEGERFIERLNTEGYIKKIENRGGIKRYEITSKIKEWSGESQLTDIWNKAHKK